ncbi:hypothetical protein EDC96DRAFT_551407 [Choanephora cucurbitarum]|nr:hypothetical protein EDC96DRAFT_551407 [Choanephora cucurbitarum]
MTTAFREFRENSIKGVQLRKSLSNQRILYETGEELETNRRRFLQEDDEISQDTTTDILETNCQLMIPDLVVYVDTVSNINFELLVIEVKKQGNCSNGEMQLALNKLIIHKVQKPTVMGLLVESLKVTAFRVDLEFDGRHKTFEIVQVFLVRGNKCDILIVPTIVQLSTQIEAIKGQGVTIDKKGYMRKICSTPLVVGADGKGKNKED